MRTFSATLRPGIRELTRGHQPGDIVARVDLDPYHRSFRNVSTHVLAPELSEPSVRAALRAGHAYVSHDWMCDPTGFFLEIREGPLGDQPSKRTATSFMMGDDVKLTGNSVIFARFPVPCHARMLNHGMVIAEYFGSSFEHTVGTPGVYRIEGWLEVGGEERGWIYANPFYVR